MGQAQRTDELLDLLLDSGFEFVVVGGVAAVMHGSTYTTIDLNVAAPFTEANMTRLLAAIGPLRPRHAITPGRRPIIESASQLASFKNLHVMTDWGRLDVLGELPPLGSPEQTLAGAETMTLGERRVRVLSLAALVAIKEHLARPKDLLVAQQLRLALAERSARERSR